MLFTEQELKTKYATGELHAALGHMQDLVIGLYKDLYTKNWMPVIEYIDGVVTYLDIGVLLGLSEVHIPVSQGTYKQFPEGETLGSIMNDPYEFTQWYKRNCQ